MPRKVTTVGVGELVAKLTRFGNAIRTETRAHVNVGYTAEYAAPLHQKKEMKWQGLPRRSGIGVYWGPSGKPKFLSDPATQNKREIAEAITRVTKNTHSLIRGLYSGGVVLRDLSLEQVPVEYGVLRDSVYIEVWTT